MSVTNCLLHQYQNLTQHLSTVYTYTLEVLTLATYLGRGQIEYTVGKDMVGTTAGLVLECKENISPLLTQCKVTIPSI